MNKMYVCKNETWVENGVCESPKPPTPEPPEPASCNDGEKRCMGDSSFVTFVQICLDGEWLDIESCDGYCINATCRTGECLTGERACANGSAMICINGYMQEVEECTDGVCINGQCIDETGECEEGERICRTDGNGASIYACKDGKWKHQTSCDSQMCENGECTNIHSACKNGDKACLMDKDETGEDVMFSVSCVDNKWQESERCPSGLCVEGKCMEPGACFDGDKVCGTENGKTAVLECRNNKWSAREFCDSMVCADAKCVDSFNECENGAPRTTVSAHISAKTTNGRSFSSAKTTCARTETARFLKHVQMASASASFTTTPPQSVYAMTTNG